jgi:hypothetical protein
MAGAIVAAIIFDLDQHGGDGKKQQDMNKIIHRIATHQPQQPQNDQYRSNRPQNVILLSKDRICPSSSIKSPPSPASGILCRTSFHRALEEGSSPPGGP